MRPIYGCPEHFGDALTTPMATFPKIFHGLVVPIDPLNMPAKFEVCSFNLF